MTAPLGRPISRIDSLQIGRAIAALIVVASHSVEDLKRLYPKQALASPFPGGFGVEVFFVISGFIIWHISRNRTGRISASADFAWVRIWRIAPLYWLSTLLYVLTATALSASVNRSNINIVHLISSIFFIPTPDPDGSMLPVLTLGWSLNFEMFFYFIIATLLWMRPRSILCIITILFGALAFSRPFLPIHSALGFFAQPFLLEFLAGVWVAELHARSSWRLPPIAIWPILLTFISVSLVFFMRTGVDKLSQWEASGGYGPNTFSIPVVIIFVLALVLCRSPEKNNLLRRALVSIGNASYSLYLLHMFVIRSLEIFAFKIHLSSHIPSILMWILLLLISCYIAWISWAFFEVPVERFGKRLRPRWLLALRDGAHAPVS